MKVTTREAARLHSTSEEDNYTAGSLKLVAVVTQSVLENIK